MTLVKNEENEKKLYSYKKARGKYAKVQIRTAEEVAKCKQSQSNFVTSRVQRKKQGSV